MLPPSRKLGLAIGVIAAFLLVAGSASAQSAITGNATATILEALTLNEDNGLDFGRILAAAGTVQVTQAGAQICTGPTCFNDAVAAQFTVTGTALETVDVTIDANFTLTEGGGDTMTATTDAPATVLIAAGGSEVFNVGGTLTVAAAQTPGVYNGTYNISVAYQ
jgi:hypothetical protein